MIRLILLCLTLSLAGPIWAQGAQQKPVLIGLDAEFGHKSSTSAQAVQQGISIAIEEINQAGGVLGGRKLELITRDNRSIPSIAVDNLRDLAAQPDLVAVFGGKFSPIYVECLPVAHELGVLLLDPWGSADLITDHSYKPSYTFRLSLKDAWAGPAMLRFAKNTYKASRVGVLLPNTAWGRSNQAALNKAAPDLGMTLVGQRWYNWGDSYLQSQYQDLVNAGAEAIVLVANENEGSILVKGIATLPESQRRPIVSHWGVTGGDFAAMAGDALGKVDFSVIQTYSFVGAKTPAARRVLAAAKAKFNIADAEHVKSPVGLAHAYDLTHLLARAIKQAASTDREMVRTAMERLGPYDGLVQHYDKPFTPARHDALSPANIFFAHYTDDDVLRPVTELKR